jgi:hypothetical protein
MTFLEFYIVPNMQPKTNVATSRKSKLDSTLIESNHITLFCFMDLIEKILHYYNIIPCQFKLLYRSNWLDLMLHHFINIVTIKGLLFG